MHPRQAGFDAETWLTGAALAGVAIVAWVWLLQTGEQGMGAPAFLGAWLVMMAAMMRNETDAPARS